MTWPLASVRPEAMVVVPPASLVTQTRASGMGLASSVGGQGVGEGDGARAGVDDGQLGLGVDEDRFDADVGGTGTGGQDDEVDALSAWVSVKR